MPDTFDLTCPACQQTVHVDQPGDRVSMFCPRCGVSIPILDVGRSGPDSHQPLEHVQQGREIRDLELPAYGDFGSGESRWTEVSLKPTAWGETLAVLALLVPLIGMVLPAYTVTTALVFGWGTVLLTAILLSVDAASMGTIDRHGNRRMSVTGLFLGIFVLWIVFYPLAFFRRRHFGRPNLGPLAILVAAIFFVVPFFKQRTLDDNVPGGEASHRPPECNHRDVIALVDDIIRNTPIVANVKSIKGHREVLYDEVRNLRVGKCTAETFQEERFAVYYNVSWIGHERRSFQVKIEEAQPEQLNQPMKPP